MNKQFNLSSIPLLMLILASSTSILTAQENLHGDRQYRKEGILDGNLVSTLFLNHGEVAHWGYQPSGVWPKGSGHSYVDGIAPFVIAKVKTNDGEEVILLETQYREFMDLHPVTGHPMGLEPLPGYTNQGQNSPALSDDQNSWPSYWPDKLDESDDPGWRGVNLETGFDPDPEFALWNGYFGKGVTNADLETYFVVDDYNDHENDIYPIASDSSRGGLGLQIYVRGFQWSHVMAEDCIFWHYEVRNISDNDYENILFGIYIDSGVGGTGDSEDDSGYFDRDLDIAVAWDRDGLGTPGDWGPVGVVGYAYLESPGNPFNGIDDDGDGIDGSGVSFTESMLDPVSYSSGDPIILIDYDSETLERTVTTMPPDSIVFTAWGDTYVVYENQILEDILLNSVDDNLNGLIDESLGHVGLLVKDWHTGVGLDNLLIDERRDDLIDNNENWDSFSDFNGDGTWNSLDEPLNDDKGRDGLGPQDPNYPGRDTGEGDGIPTPGEPDFDQTDKDESDQIGLTGVKVFRLHEIDLKDDERVWNELSQGIYQVEQNLSNLGIIFASGPFPLKRGQSQRFSMALLFGENLDDLVRNKDIVQRIYNANYNFARPPDKPNLEAVAGDRQVTLYWDSRSEESVDPFLNYRKDFEGYVIYKSTEPAFLETKVITDSYGVKTFRKPVAQFDLIDGIFGPDPVGINGARFNRGDETGLKHQWVDTDVFNGQTYYYAVVAYDQGDLEYLGGGLPPTECTSTISVDAFGNVVATDINTAVVTPSAPVAGYIAPEIVDLEHVRGPGTGSISLESLNPMAIRPDTQYYEIRFDDSTLYNEVSFSVWNVTADNEIYYDGATHLDGSDYNEVFDGIRPFVKDDSLVINETETRWLSDRPHDSFIRVQPSSNGVTHPADYMIVFYDSVVTEDVIGSAANFTIHNITENKPVDFFFEDQNSDGFLNPAEAQQSSALEFIAFVQMDGYNLTPNWDVWVELYPAAFDDIGGGDTIFVATHKPFRADSLADVYAFKTFAPVINKADAKKDLHEIAVVPNPYVATASWEPFHSKIGRGLRIINFINLPSPCTIRIYTFSGDLVNTIKHSATLGDNWNYISGADSLHISFGGSEPWDLRSKDGLDVAYGVYFYHVDAPGVGEFMGKFALIK